MRKRCITGILLAALLVSLCGCTSVFDKEYLSVRPYEEPSNLLTDADTTQIRNYAGLMRAREARAARDERAGGRAGGARAGGGGGGGGGAPPPPPTPPPRQGEER